MEYIICTSQRTGSTLLANTLKAMNVGQPDEFFNTLFSPELTVLPLHDYISKIKQTQSSNGIFGIKIHYCQIEQFKLQSEIIKLFPDAKYIWLYRRNKIRQAISLWKAMCNNCWNSKTVSKKIVNYNRGAINDIIIKLTKEIEHWENFFSNYKITPFEIVYENLDNNYYKTVSDVLDFLNVKGDIPPPVLEKQSDNITEFWVSRFMNNF